MSGMLECMRCGGFYPACEHTDDGGLSYVGVCPNCGKWNVATVVNPPAETEVVREPIGAVVTTRHNLAFGLPGKTFKGEGWKARLKEWIEGMDGCFITEVYE